MPAAHKKKPSSLQRQQAAALKPQTMSCTKCQMIITDIEEMRSGVVKQIPGMNFIFIGACHQCGHEEWLFIGTVSAVASAKRILPLLAS